MIGAIKNSAAWHAAQEELDVAGAACSSAFCACLVSELIDLGTFYDGQVRRIVEIACSLPDEPAVDLDLYNDSILGPHLQIDGRELTGPIVARIVAVSHATDVPGVVLGSWVVALPCSPCRICVAQMGQAIAAAARYRTARGKLREIEHRIDDDPAVVEWLAAVLVP